MRGRTFRPPALCKQQWLFLTGFPAGLDSAQSVRKCAKAKAERVKSLQLSNPAAPAMRRRSSAGSAPPPEDRGLRHLRNAMRVGGLNFRFSEARRWCDYSEDEEDGEDLGALWLRDGFTRAQVDSVSLTASSSCSESEPAAVRDLCRSRAVSAPPPMFSSQNTKSTSANIEAQRGHVPGPHQASFPQVPLQGCSLSSHTFPRITSQSARRRGRSPTCRPVTSCAQREAHIKSVSSVLARGCLNELYRRISLPHLQCDARPTEYYSLSPVASSASCSLAARPSNCWWDAALAADQHPDVSTSSRSCPWTSGWGESQVLFFRASPCVLGLQSPSLHRWWLNSGVYGYSAVPSICHGSVHSHVPASSLESPSARVSVQTFEVTGLLDKTPTKLGNTEHNQGLLMPPRDIPAKAHLLGLNNGTGLVQIQLA